MENLRAIKVTLSQDIDMLQVHAWADWHLGDENCRLDLIKKRIVDVQNNPNAYVILNGDIMNNATRKSVSDIYTETLSPGKQIDQCVKLLRPIKEKILAVTSGNHCFRTYKHDGLDLMEIAVKELGIEDKFNAGACLVFLRFGRNVKEHSSSRQNYTIYCLHGAGGGRKEGAKAIRLADMSSIIDADVYLHSHTHLPMVMKQDFLRVDRLNSTYAPVTKLFVNSAATLSYGGYGEAAEFKPASTDNPIILLDGRKKNATAIL